MDESTKRNIVKNLERKIGRYTTIEEDRVSLEQRLWRQLRRNGYRKKKEGRKEERIERRGRRRETKAGRKMV